LEALEHKVTSNTQINQTLEQRAQALFKSWFVDFDPVFDNALAAGTNVSDFPEALQQRAELRKQAQQLPDFKALPDDVAKSICLYSNEDILEKFEKIAGQFLSKKAASEQQLKPLASLRETLLPKLISGELII
jgi:hypothetical protein